MNEVGWTQSLFARWSGIGGNTISAGGEKHVGTHTLQPFERADASSWEVNERVALLDQMGIWAQVLYPNDNAVQPHLRDRRSRPAHRGAAGLQRLPCRGAGRVWCPSADAGILPIWDMVLAVREMTRLLDRGMRGFTLSDKPELLGLPERPEQYFEPMWDLLNESGAIANSHIGALLTSRSRVCERSGEEASSASPRSLLTASHRVTPSTLR